MARCKMHMVGTLKLAALEAVLDSLGVEHHPHSDHPDTLILVRMPLERLQKLRWAVENISR